MYDLSCSSVFGEEGGGFFNQVVGEEGGPQGRQEDGGEVEGAAPQVVVGHEYHVDDVDGKADLADESKREEFVDPGCQGAFVEEEAEDAEAAQDGAEHGEAPADQEVCIRFDVDQDVFGGEDAEKQEEDRVDPAEGIPEEVLFFSAGDHLVEVSCGHADKVLVEVDLLGLSLFEEPDAVHGEEVPGEGGEEQEEEAAEEAATGCGCGGGCCF